MILSKATEYSIRALVYIRSRMETHRFIGFREIAREIGAPEPFTGKVLQTLVKKGFLQSSKGPGGGFFLDEKKGPIPLIGLVLSLEGTTFFTRCGLGLKNCSSENPCPIHKDYAKIRGQFEKLMESETIWSLAKKLKNGKAVINNSAIPDNNQ
jgi:Rrf2 family protein